MTMALSRSHKNRINISAVALCALMWVITMPAGAVLIPAVPPGINCQSIHLCGLYADVSGSASASLTGGQAFSHQPSWTATNSLFVNESATDQSGAFASALSTDFATFGALRSRTTALSSGSGSNAHANSTANATIAFQDRLTFMLPGAPAGTTATMVGRLHASGSVNASSDPFPFADASALAQMDASGGVGLVTHSVQALSDGRVFGGIPGLITFEAGVKFNEPDFTLLFVQLRTAAQSGALSIPGQFHSAAANAEFFSSLEWDGIDSVLDDQGNPITGWSLASGSGFDYTRSFAAQLPAAVPEPGSWALMMTGLALLGFVGRGRKQKGA